MQGRQPEIRNVLCWGALLLLFLSIGVASGGELPDHRLTPGTKNPDVTQNNIQNTICIRGYTKTIRPPANYTNRLKKKQIAQYGYGHANPKAFEEDHLISLGIGGNPTDPKNLWPEPRNGHWSASRKDKLEYRLHELVCNMNVTLDQAQQEMSTNWIQAYRKYIGPW
ncbi:MAG TPA: hypothetical protein VLV32_10100 [Burkholderiales bacterium]|nr:hypothetical protein [Burkholderiales bacterium]